jgi:hypothetical protein
VNVGTAGFSVDSVYFTSLAINSFGQPYVAYSDYVISGKATVMYYDAPTGTKEPEYSQLSLYPNPVSNSLTIDLKNIIDKIKSLEVTNINGMKIFETQTSAKEIILNVENLPSGIYIVHLKTESSNYIRKFCKN